MIPRAEGYRPAVIRESRIKDRPQTKSLKDDSLSIKIELDLEVEVSIILMVLGFISLSDYFPGGSLRTSERRCYHWAALNAEACVLAQVLP